MLGELKEIGREGLVVRRHNGRFLQHPRWGSRFMMQTVDDWVETTTVASVDHFAPKLWRFTTTDGHFFELEEIDADGQGDAEEPVPTSSRGAEMPAAQR